jgi:hypothetical protein
MYLTYVQIHVFDGSASHPTNGTLPGGIDSQARASATARGGADGGSLTRLKANLEFKIRHPSNRLIIVR